MCESCLGPGWKVCRPHHDLARLNLDQIARVLLHRVIDQQHMVGALDRAGQAAQTADIPPTYIGSRNAVTAACDADGDTVYRDLHVLEANVIQVDPEAGCMGVVHKPQDGRSSKSCLYSEALSPRNRQALKPEYLAPGLGRRLLR